jgi:hypothetical protein
MINKYFNSILLTIGILITTTFSLMWIDTWKFSDIVKGISMLIIILTEITICVSLTNREKLKKESVGR